MRFHFIVNGDVDTEGAEFASVRDAQCEALARAGRIICDADADTFWAGGDWSMKVTAPGGLVLFELMLLGIEAPAILKTDIHLA